MPELGGGGSCPNLNLFYFLLMSSFILSYLCIMATSLIRFSGKTLSSYGRISYHGNDQGFYKKDNQRWILAQGPCPARNFVPEFQHFNQPFSTTVLNSSLSCYSSPNRNTNVMAAIQLVQLADAICNKMLFGISCQEHCAVGVLGSMTLSSYSFFQPLKRISSH